MGRTCSSYEGDDKCIKMCGWATSREKTSYEMRRRWQDNIKTDPK